MGDGFAEVLGGQYGGVVGLQGFEGLAGGGQGGGQGFFVSEVGDGQVALKGGQGAAVGG